MIHIPPSLDLPDEEVSVSFVRSRGPGGQNVNKLETAAILVFNLDASRSLSESQRSTLRAALAARLTRSGELRLRSERHRTQRDNRRDVLRRFVAMMSAALTPIRPRVATRPTTGSRIRRRRSKQFRSIKKLARRSGQADE